MIKKILHQYLCEHKKTIPISMEELTIKKFSQITEHQHILWAEPKCLRFERIDRCSDCGNLLKFNFKTNL